MNAGRTARAVFQTTNWTQVLEAADLQMTFGGSAFAELYLAYWTPLYAFARRRGLAPPEAEDIIQDFFTHLVSKQSLSGLQRDGGRFRSFLVKSLEHFLANEHRRTQAQKRGQGQRPLSLNPAEGEACFALDATNGETPESIFEKRWAFTVLEHVRERLREEYTGANKRDLFEHLRVHLQGDRSGPAYATVAAQLGLSENALKVAVHRMRHRYGELLRQAIARTVSSPAEVDEELRYLISVVGS